MQQLKYRIKTCSPLLVAETSGDPNLVSTKDYIPGSILRGMFAGRFIKNERINEKAHQNQDFKRIFLHEDVFFLNAYPGSAGDKASVILPFSVQAEKEDEDKIHDLLFSDPDCQTKAVGGFALWYKDSAQKKIILTKIPLHKTLYAHHVHDPETGAASQEGLLFNYEAIDPEQKFVGAILGEEADLQKVRKLINPGETIAIGRSRGVQYGKVEWSWLDEKPGEFNISDMTGINPSDPVALTLISPLILHNQNGSSTTCLDDLEKELKRHLGSKTTIKKSWIKTMEVESFLSVWKLPRPSDTAFAAGSCFLIEGIEDGNQSMKNLENKGMGERRSEGFGRVVFGMQQGVQIVSDKNHEEKIDAPTHIPRLTREIAEKILLNEMLEQVRINAYTDAGGFKKSLKNIKSKSLISRLDAMAKKNDRERFVKIVEKELRDTAQKNLERLDNGRMTLIDFIKDKNKKANEMPKIDLELDEKDPLQEVLKDSKDEQNQDQLWKEYWGTFFPAIRKMMKGEEQ